MLVIDCRVLSWAILTLFRMKATHTRLRLGEKIRKLRLDMDISQEELGFRSKVHRTYIGAIERGEQNVSVDSLHRIARALKVKPEE